MSIIETLGNTNLSPEFSASFFSQHPAFVDLKLFPDGIPSDPQDPDKSRVVDMGTVLFLGEHQGQSGERQAHFAFPEAPDATEFSVEVDTYQIAFPVLPNHQEYEMIFHSQGVNDSLNGHRPAMEPFSMGPVILEGLVKNVQGSEEFVVAYPERPDEPFTMPTELITFSPAQKGQNASHR